MRRILVVAIVVILFFYALAKQAHGAEGRMMYGEWYTVENTEESKYEVRHSTIQVGDVIVGNYNVKGIALDLAAALNDARERRTQDKRPRNCLSQDPAPDGGLQMVPCTDNP